MTGQGFRGIPARVTHVYELTYQIPACVWVLIIDLIGGGDDVVEVVGRDIWGSGPEEVATAVDWAEEEIGRSGLPWQHMPLADVQHRYVATLEVRLHDGPDL